MGSEAESESQKLSGQTLEEIGVKLLCVLFLTIFSSQRENLLTLMNTVMIKQLE